MSKPQPVIPPIARNLIKVQTRNCYFTDQAAIVEELIENAGTNRGDQSVIGASTWRGFMSGAGPHESIVAGTTAAAAAYRGALAERQVKLIPLVCEDGVFERLIVERHNMHRHHGRGR